MKRALLSVFASFAFCISFAANIEPPTAAISYGSPFCNGTFQGQAVILTGTGNYTGGTFSASPVGLDLDAVTGSIDPSGSIPGVYTVTYNIAPAGPDPGFTATTLVEIILQPNAGTDGTITICDNSTAPISLSGIIVGEQSGGVWTQTSGTGGTFNAAAGIYTPAAGATTQTFTYTITGTAPCIADSSLATVVVNLAQVSTFGFSAVTICEGSLFPLPPVSDQGITGTWNPAIANLSGTYVFTPDMPCALQGAINVTVIPAPVAVLSPDSSVCAGDTANVTIQGSPNGIVVYTVNGGTAQTVVLDAARDRGY